MAIPTVASFTFTPTVTYGNSVICNLPAGIQAGDILLAIFMDNESQTIINTLSISDPSWNKFVEVGSSTGDAYVGSWWKTADGTETGSVTINHGNHSSQYSIAWILRITGANTTNPINIIGTKYELGTNTILTRSTSITTTVPNCLVIAMHATNYQRLMDPQTTNGWDTDFIDSNQNLYPISGGNIGGCWHLKEMPIAGDSGDCDIYANSTTHSTSIQIAIGPAIPTIQEGFRFRNDDGTESTASWSVDQDTADNIEIGGKKRIRIITDSDKSITDARASLEYKRSDETEAEWRILENIQVTSNIPVIEDIVSPSTLGVDYVNGTYITLTKPSGVVTGELLMMICMSGYFSGDPWVDIAGWTMIFYRGYDTAVAIYYRIADGTEGSTETVGSTASEKKFGYYLRLSGVDIINPIGVKDEEVMQGAYNGVMGNNSLTTLKNNTLAICIGVAYDNVADLCDSADGLNGWTSSTPTIYFSYLQNHGFIETKDIIISGETGYTRWIFVPTEPSPYIWKCQCQVITINPE